MIQFNMTDILPLLPIQQPHSNRSSYNVPCPCCDGDRIRNGHLNINLSKNVFRCPRCGFSGGVLDLYAYYANVNRNKALAAIAEKLQIDIPRHSGQTQKSQPSVPVVREHPLADIEVRDATYRALLEKLSLASDHKDNLLNRGLSESAITEKNYRTTPAVGRQSLARQLQNEGLYLSGVPGFHREKDGNWVCIETGRGILIPVRDIKGRIQGLQVRLDQTARRKFRWISSSERQDGCKAEGWTHLAGDICEEILLIEGPMKADIVNHLTGMTALAVPGVNSLTRLQTTLSELMTLGVKRVMTCFDMDMMKNPHVQQGYSALLWMLDGMGLEFGTYLWHPHYNGLDDYIWKWCLR